MGTRSGDSSSGSSVRRIAGSFLAGLVAIGVVAIAAIDSSRFVLAAVLSPAVGGAVSGFFARGRRRLGTVLGMLLGLTVMISSFALFGYWLANAPPMTGGAGLGIAALFLIVVVVGLLAILFGGLGGLLGATLRSELDRAPRTGAVEEREDTADSGRFGDSGSADVTVDSRPEAERPTVGSSDRDADDRTVGSSDRDADDRTVGSSDRDADDRTADDRRPITNVMVGSALSTVIFFVPGSPFIGGVATGYLEQAGWRRGAVLGAVSGLVATPLVLAVLVLLAVAVFFVFAGVFVDYLPWLAALLAAYFVVLSAVGGAIGGALSSPRTNG
ncbi:DUF5518 domain-containing protein [Natrinema halophilum]|uniref:DUF5518 domain-containing protein n=1 Tax=Natrinema halophilum TaxID=1699371 RepID=A0A7D5KXV2_9EURY|nr:DUF5518 domain-containing protein [Natrinema halophilum]QLG49602.1 DUF5518 domain-containing protein [Natrinema halophilum]